MLTLVEYISNTNFINNIKEAINDYEQSYDGHINQCIAKEDNWELFWGGHAKERTFRHVETGGMSDKINKNKIIKTFKKKVDSILNSIGNVHQPGTPSAYFTICDHTYNPNLNIVCKITEHTHRVTKFVIVTVISKNSFKTKNNEKIYHINESKLNMIIYNIYE